MIHKRFQLDFEKGSIETQLDLEYDGETIFILNIHLKGNYNTNLPTNPEIRHNDEAGERQFYSTYPNSKGERIWRFDINDEGRAVIQRIYEIVQEEIPHFI